MTAVRQMLRRLRWPAAGALVVGVAAYVAVRLVLGGMALESRVVALARAQVKGTLTCDAVEGGLFGGLVARNLRVTDGGDAEPFLEIETVRARPRLLPLLWGGFELAGVTLEQPRLRVRRDGSGRWNIAQRFLGGWPPAAGRAEVRAVGLALDYSDEIHALGISPQTFANITLDCTRGRGGRIDVTGEVRDNRFGVVRFEASFAPDGRRARGRLTLADALLEPNLRGLVPVQVRTWWDRLSISSGVLSGTMDLRWNEAGTPALTYDGEARIHNATMRSPHFPYTVSSLDATVKVTTDGLELANCSARVEDGTALAEGRIAWADGGRVDFAAQFQRLRLSQAMAAMVGVLSPAAERFWLAARPSGDIDVRIGINGPLSGKTRPAVSVGATLLRGRLDPVGIGAPVTDICGFLTYRDGLLLLHDVSGRWAQAPVSVPSCRVALGGDATVPTSAEIRSVRLTTELKNALPETWVRSLPLGLAGCWRDLAVAGTADVHISMTGDGDEKAARVAVTLHNAELRHPRAPFPLRDVNGTVAVKGKKIEVGPLSAAMGPLRLSIKDGVLTCAADGVQHLVIIGGGPRVDKDVFALLPASLQPLQERFSPAGAVGVQCEVVRAPGKDQPELWHTRLSLRDGQVVDREFPYALRGVDAELELRETRLVAARLKGRNGEAVVEVNAAAVDTGDAPGWRVSVNARGVALDEALLAALPASCRRVWAGLKPTGRAGLDATFLLRAADTAIGAGGTVNFEDLRLEAGLPLTATRATVTFGESKLGDGPLTARLAAGGATLGRNPLDAVEATIRVQGESVRVEPITARTGEGKVSGRLLLRRLTDGQVSYEGEWRAADVDAAAAVKSAGLDMPALKGTISAETKVWREGSPVASLRGDGKMQVSGEGVESLPGAAEVAAFCRARGGEAARPEFQAATFGYELSGDEVRAKSLRLVGRRMALSGAPAASDAAAGGPAFILKREGESDANVPAVLKVVTDLLARNAIATRIGSRFDQPPWRLDPLLPWVSLSRGLADALSAAPAAAVTVVPGQEGRP